MNAAIITSANGITQSVSETYYTKSQAESDLKNKADANTSVQSVKVMYYASTSPLSLFGGSWSELAPTFDYNRYVWSKTITTYANGDVAESRPVCIAGAQGKPGDDGVGIVSIVNYYLRSDLNSGVTTSTPGWTTDIQIINSDYPYLWNYEVVTYTVGDPTITSPCIIGTYGTAASSMYTWIKYADSPTSGMSDNPEGKKYLGLAYNKSTSNESASYSDYSWSLIKGTDGQPGPTGYTWVKYADDATGTNMSDDPTDKFYIGLAYNKTSSTSSNNANDYVWSLFRGSDGAPGDPGKGIVSITEYYARSASNTVAPTNWEQNPPALNSTDKYLWNYEVIAYTEGQPYTSEKRVIGVYGDTGSDGIGIEYIKAQYYLSSSKTSQTGGSWQDTAPAWSVGKYLWTRSEIKYTNGKIVHTSPYCDTGWEAANEKGKVWFQDAAPSADKVSVNDLWIDTKNGANTPKRWNGSSWVAVSDNIAVTAKSESTQNKEAITSLVTLGIQDENGETLAEMGSRVNQTLKSIHSEVYGQDVNGNKASSSLKQTVDSISSYVIGEDGKMKSILEQTPDSILAAVKEQNANTEADNDFKTSSVSITKDGVAISTNGVFSVSAEDDDEFSAVTIDKDGVAIGSSGSLSIQTDNFAVTPDGKISANNVVINGQLSNNGYPVMMKNYDIYIGSMEPANPHPGMIWICPGVPKESGGNGTVDVPTNSNTSSQTITFTGYTDPYTRHWFYDNGPASVSLTSSSYCAGTKNSYTYEITIPIYLAKRSDTAKHGAKFKVSLNGAVNASKVVTWPGSSAGSFTVTLSATSSVWLGDSSSITAVVSISRESTDSKTGNIYLDRDDTVVVTCS